MTDDPSLPRQAGQPGSGEEQQPARPWFPPSGEPADGWQPPPGGWPPSGTTGRPPYGSWPAPAPKPGIIPLRPLSVGEILDGAFTSVRRNPKATLGLAAAVLAIAAVFTTILQVILNQAMNRLFGIVHSPSVSSSQALHQVVTFLGVGLPVSFAVLIITVIADIFLTGLLTVVIGGSVLGQTVTAGQAWRTARPRLLSLLAVVALTVGGGIGLLVAWGLLIALVAVAGAPAWAVVLAIVGFGLAGLCVTIWLAIMFKLAGPAVMLEGAGPLTAMGRSWRLVQGSWWRIFGISLLARLVVTVAAGILEIPFTLVALIGFGGIGSVFPGVGQGTAVGQGTMSVLVSAVGSVIAGAVTRPVAAGVTVLLYVDLRIRREGFDLVLQQAAAGQAGGGPLASMWQPAAGKPGAMPPPAPGGPPAW